MTTIAELIVTLQAKDPAQEVEYFVVMPSGEVVAVHVGGKVAKALIPVLKIIIAEED